MRVDLQPGAVRMVHQEQADAIIVDLIDDHIDVPVLPRLAVSAPEAAAQAAIRGVGVTRLLHYQVADAIRRRELKIILATFEPEPAPVHLVHASEAAFASM
jgi:DNA-binding transcriptional LysR family regulator